MASNGLLNPAKKGRCRICQRVRKTFGPVIPVGEVRKGYATGYVWECSNQTECEQVAKDKLKKKDISGVVHNRIEYALGIGHLTDYPIYV